MHKKKILAVMLVASLVSSSLNGLGINAASTTTKYYKTAKTYTFKDKRGIKKIIVNNKKKKIKAGVKSYKLRMIKAGKYKVSVVNKKGKTKKYIIYIDKKKPSISGVKNNGIYIGTAYFKISDNIKLSSAILDNTKLNISKTKNFGVSSLGKHILTVKDKAGNKTIISFTITDSSASQLPTPETTPNTPQNNTTISPSTTASEENPEASVTPTVSSSNAPVPTEVSTNLPSSDDEGKNTSPMPDENNTPVPTVTNNGNVQTPTDGENNQKTPIPTIFDNTSVSNKIKLNYIVDGKIIESMEVKKNKRVYIDVTAPEKDTAFAGWSIYPDYDTMVQYPGEKYNIGDYFYVGDKDCNLYGVYYKKQQILPTPTFSIPTYTPTYSEVPSISPKPTLGVTNTPYVTATPIPKITIKYELNGGRWVIGAENSCSITKGEKINLPFANKDDCDFLYWETISGQKYLGGHTYTFSENTILYARFQHKSTVRFYLNGGSSTDDVSVKTVKDGDTLKMPSAEKKDCCFLGWSESKDSKKGLYLPGNCYTFSKSCSLYAQFEAIKSDSNVNSKNEVVVRIYGQGGIPAYSSLTFPKNEWIKLPTNIAPTLQNYTFTEFSTDPLTKNGEFYRVGESYFLTHDVVLYACYEPEKNTYIFDNNNGVMGIDSITQSFVEKLQVPNDVPKKKGCEFQFWSDKKDGSGKRYYPGNSYKSSEICNPGEKVVLYAIWKSYDRIYLEQNFDFYTEEDADKCIVVLTRYKGNSCRVDIKNVYNASIYSNEIDEKKYCTYVRASVFDSTGNTYGKDSGCFIGNKNIKNVIFGEKVKIFTSYDEEHISYIANKAGQMGMADNGICYPEQKFEKNMNDWTGLFYGCSKLNAVEMPSVSGCTDISYIFAQCSALQSISCYTNGYYPRFFIPMTLERAEYAFFNCSSLSELPSFSSKNKLKYAKYMFYGCNGWSVSKNIYINGGGASNDTLDLSHTFENCKSLSSYLDVYIILQGKPKKGCSNTFKNTGGSNMIYLSGPNNTIQQDWIGIADNNKKVKVDSKTNVSF